MRVAIWRALRRLSWRVVIVDEAQNIKNPSAAQTKAIKSITFIEKASYINLAV